MASTTRERNRFCSVRWSQTHDFLLILIDVPCYFGIVKERVDVKISSDKVNFKVVETIDDTNVEYTVPSNEMNLFREVEPDASSFMIKPQCVRLQCCKKVKGIWNQLSTEKWSWIHRYDVLEDDEMGEIDSDSFVEVVQKKYDIEPQPEAAFEVEYDYSDIENDQPGDSEGESFKSEEDVLTEDVP